jgi:hypothetical protein
MAFTGGLYCTHLNSSGGVAAAVLSDGKPKPDWTDAIRGLY